MTLEDLLKKFLRFSTAGPALTRFYLMPHVKLHHIKQDDSEYHSHPWNGVSFIFGSYLEAFEDLPSFQNIRIRRGFNKISAFRRHKVLLRIDWSKPRQVDGEFVRKPVWT